MKRWIHLLSSMPAAASVAHDATPETVSPHHRPAPGGWKSNDDRRSSVPRSPRQAGRPTTERTDALAAHHRDLLLEPGPVAANDNPLDQLRRGGLI